MTEPSRHHPAFYTVAETAELLRVNTMTIYRAIGDLAFPAVKIRGRYIVPAIAIEALARDATRSNTCVDVSDYALTRTGAGVTAAPPQPDAARG